MTSKKVFAQTVAAAGLVSIVSLGTALAQVQPSPIPTGQRPGADKKPEGVAEKAPTKPGLLPTTPVLPPPKSEKKRFELFRLDGYFRWRGDWFKNFHLGFNDDPTIGGAPFPQPLACKSTTADAPCESTLKTSNIRMRLEPVISVGEDSSVHLQIDVLDNLILGSTPVGSFGDGTPRPTNIPLNAFAGGQAPPQVGRNSTVSGIQVKHAYAKVMTPLGLLQFGRMPFHWGLGIVSNSGGADPIHGTYDFDGDFGDIADRLLFGTKIPGTEYKIAVGMDWVSTVPTSAQSTVFNNRYFGQAWDLDDNDDVNQWLVVITKQDSPDQWQDILDQGELALNYGAFFVYRTQSWDNTSYTLGSTPDPARFVRRDGKAYIPDVWLRLGHKKLTFEFEGVAILGTINDLSDLGISESLDVRQFGAVGKLDYKMAEDKLKLGLEIGYASGDQWDNSVEGITNVRGGRALVDDVNDTTVSAFAFDFDYKIDLILWRELYGQITNATYVRPSFQYDLTKQIRLKLWSVISWANNPVATPGNGSMYGVEFDGDIGYQNEGFFAGISYGILFPLGAMDHPDCPAVFGETGPGFAYGCSNDPVNNVGDAGNAQTIQTRLMLKF